MSFCDCVSTKTLSVCDCESNSKRSSKNDVYLFKIHSYSSLPDATKMKFNTEVS